MNFSHLPPTNSQTARRVADCLTLYRLPARIDGRQAAALLGFQPHDIAVLMAARLLVPLGKPVPNAPKYFATCVLEGLRENPDWLDKASRAVSKHWQTKNEKRTPKPGPGEPIDSGEAQEAE